MTKAATLAQSKLQVVSHQPARQLTQPAGEKSVSASAPTPAAKGSGDIEPYLDQAIARLSPVTLVQDGEQWSVHFQGMSLPAQFIAKGRQQLLNRLAEATEDQAWMVSAYLRTDEQGLVQLEVTGLKAPAAEVVNWVRLQGQVKGRDKDTGRLFIHLRRNRKDKNGQRPAWTMTVQGSVAKPGRYQLICSIESGALVLVDGELLPNPQPRAEAVTSPSLLDPETTHRPAESLLVDPD
jgi:hypothetical protein